MSDSNQSPEQPPASDAGQARPPSGAEKRRHPRTAMNLLVQFRFETFEEFLKEYALDISVGGMFIRTEATRPEGSLLYLQFALKDGARLIEGLGRVVRVNGPAPGRVAGMGVEFVNLDAESTELIDEIVAFRSRPPAG